MINKQIFNQWLGRGPLYTPSHSSRRVKRIPESTEQDPKITAEETWEGNSDRGHGLDAATGRGLTVRESAHFQSSTGSAQYCVRLPSLESSSPAHLRGWGGRWQDDKSMTDDNSPNVGPSLKVPMEHQHQGKFLWAQTAVCSTAANRLNPLRCTAYSVRSLTSQITVIKPSAMLINWHRSRSW